MPLEDDERIVYHFAGTDAETVLKSVCTACAGTGDCESCEGEGTHLCDKCDDEHDCGKCSGTGKCEACDGVGGDPARREIVNIAEATVSFGLAFDSDHADYLRAAMMPAWIAPDNLRSVDVGSNGTPYQARKARRVFYDSNKE